MRHILVTGAHGFIGRNLVLTLRRDVRFEVTAVDIDTPNNDLITGLEKCCVIFHLAGINRPLTDDEFEAGNVGSLASVLSELEKRQRRPLLVLSSSVQASLDNPYGRSKRRAEELLLDYCRRTESAACLFRLPGVFGKWCRPNYNSVVATFCHNISRDLPIQIIDSAREIELVYVDDVVTAFIVLLDKEHNGAAYFDVTPIFQIKLGDLAEKIYAFRKSRESLQVSDLSDSFLRRLYGTYLSYLPSDRFAYLLERKTDHRGALAEVLKADGHGQIFISRTKPGIVRGNHYHERKVEKFIVVEGEALISFRNMATDEKVEYQIRGHDTKVVDIPPGWTHSIKNTGSSDMIVLFWASEIFDPDCPDTYSAEV